MSVEIYICREGQALKDGKVEFSSSIYGREDAESDAKARCERQTWIKKMAYYKVSESGDFRIFYSYTNPNCTGDAKAKPQTVAKRKPGKKKKTIKKKTLWQKVKAAFK